MSTQTTPDNDHAETQPGPSPSARTAPRRRWRKRLFIGLGAVISLVLLLIVFAPTLINMGVGNGLAKAAASRAIGGAVDWSSVSTLSWLGDEQRIEGLTITDGNGFVAGELDVTIADSLLSFAGGLPAAIRTTIAGELHAKIDDHGAILAPDFLAAKDAGQKNTGASRSASGGQEIFPASTSP